jgi:predicted RNA-binding Zn-ribbon protein involved in translation (DUF1610 family)
VPQPPDRYGPADPLIDCIDCGGRCHLMVTWADDNPPEPGDVVVYRCEDCNDRWDIVIPASPDEGDAT